LLQVLGGMYPPTAGEIRFDGRRLTSFSPTYAQQQGIEMVYQHPQLVEALDITRNIFLGRELKWPPGFGIPVWSEMRRQAAALLARFDVPPGLLRERTSNLTNEFRQVVALAQALCRPCRLLLLDEPLELLSFQRQQILLEMIKALAEQGTAILISGDNLKHLFAVTDRILVLYEGRLAAERRTAESTPREIVELIVGDTRSEQVTPVIWALESYHAAQHQTEELRRSQTQLQQNLAVQDSLNRQLIERLHDQVKALDQLNLALQAAQRRLMTEREEERKALARELHDQVMQDLLSFNYRLEETEDHAPAQRDELASIRGGIRQVVGDLRQICSDLRPPTIDRHGLPAALSSLAQEWAERTGVSLDLQLDPELGRLPEAIELSLFRIVQEGLSNIHKHAAARQVHLTLQRTPSANLLLRLADDGQGLTAPPDLADLSARKHFGLLGISERVALLGGTMRLESPPGGGAVLLVEIPSPYPTSC
jgi:signal transduction histidine kinase